MTAARNGTGSRVDGESLPRWGAAVLRPYPEGMGLFLGFALFCGGSFHAGLEFGLGDAFFGGRFCFWCRSRRRGGRLLRALCWLLVFFLLLREFLDAGKFAQSFYALFGGFAAAIQLDGEDFLNDFVEFWSAGHAQCFQFRAHDR